MADALTIQHADPATRPEAYEIVVDGQINLGELLDVVQETGNRLNNSFQFAGFMPTGGGLSAVDVPFVDSSQQNQAGSRLAWKLERTSLPLQMSRKGLTESYMIFGGPGSGKTYLLMYLLKQIFALNAGNPAAKVGALILDPKAALVEQVTEMLTLAGRLDDLIVLNSDTMKAAGSMVNIIDADVDGAELGAMMVLAAQASGTGASEEFWFGAWTTLFSAVAQLLSWTDERVLTIDRLMRTVLEREGVDEKNRPLRRIQRIARDAQTRLVDLSAEQRNDMELAIDEIDGFYRQEEDNIATVETLMRRAYSGFLRSKWQRYSYAAPKMAGKERTRFYDQIIDEGKIVLVSISPSEPMMAKVLCTLVKVLFQRTVLARLDRVRSGSLSNFTRLVVMAVDEYSAVASEVQGQPMGDGLFFSQCRQNGAIGIVATQSVNLLQSSSLKDNWKSVTSVCAAKLFMRLADNETAEEATKLAGEYDWDLISHGTSQQKDGSGTSTNNELRERKALPAAILTQVLTLGQAAVVGSLDGKATADTLRFFQTPKWK